MEYKTVLENKKQSGRLTLTEFKIHYKATAAMRVLME